MNLSIVTKGKDSGPDTLRQAIKDATGPTLICFATSGEFEMESDIVIDKPGIYLAGQTAPWPGVMLQGGYSLRIKASDTTVESLHVWPGRNESKADNLDGISIETGDYLQDVTVKRCSIAFSTDEALVCWGSGAKGHMTGLTITDNLIYHPILYGGHSKGVHNYGVLLGAHCGAITYARNLVAHCGKRMPVQQGDTQLLMYNNIAYNWSIEGLHITDQDGPTDSRIYNNVILPGRDSKIKREECAPWSLRVKLRHPESKLIMSGNQIEGGQTIDTQNAFVDLAPENVPSDLIPASRVLDLVGAIAGPKHRNEIDEQVIRDVQDRMGGTVEEEADLLSRRRVRRNYVENIDKHPIYNEYDPFRWREWLAQWG